MKSLVLAATCICEYKELTISSLFVDMIIPFTIEVDVKIVVVFVSTKLEEVGMFDPSCELNWTALASETSVNDPALVVAIRFVLETVDITEVTIVACVTLS